MSESSDGSVNYSARAATIVDTTNLSSLHLSHPIVSVIPSLTGYVLEVLANVGRPLAGREIQRLLGREASHTGVQRVLDALAAQGGVNQLEAGPAILNSLNPNHMLTPLIRQLAEVKARIILAIAEIVSEEASQLERAILFGSVARGEADEQSDVDLLFVWRADSPEAERSKAASRISRRVKNLLGNACNVIGYETDEFESLSDDAPAFAREVRRDGIALL